MVEKAEDPKSRAVSACDMDFLSILKTLSEQIQATTEAAASNILQISSNFLSSEASVALKRFRDLYFSADANLVTGKTDVNRDVDAIVENVRQQLRHDKDVDASKVTEDAAIREQRLSLSGVQKELESIIAIENGIRDKLHPALTTMQFEDAMRQRLGHLVDGWECIMQAFAKRGFATKNREGEFILALLSSNAERRLFYEQVMHEEPPPETTSDDPTITGLF